MSRYLGAAIRVFGKPATWTRLGLIGTAVGWQIAPEQWDKIATFCMGGSAIVAMLLDEIQTEVQRRRPSHHEP